MPITTVGGQTYANELAYRQATTQPTPAVQTPAVSAPSNTAITPSAMTGATPIQVTAPPQPTAHDITQTNTAIGTTNGLLTPSPTPTQTTDTSNDWIKQFLASSNPPPTAEGQYTKDYTSSGIDTKQTDLNTKLGAVKTSQAKLGALNAQLAGITAQAQAIPIQIQSDAQAGGANVTKAGLQPIQTAALRNNALQAIPLQTQILGAQAEVASAQGDAQLAQNILDQANTHLDRVYQIHQQDATNMYNYQKDLRDKAFSYISSQKEKEGDRSFQRERDQLVSLQRVDDRRFTLLQNDLNNAQELSKLALQSGQSQLASQITALDPNSPTYRQDLAKLQSKIALQVVQKAREAPTVKSINGVDMQWNPANGKWETINEGLGSTGVAGSTGVQKAKDGIALVVKSLDNADKFSEASGQSGLRKTLASWFVGSTDYTNLVAETNTLRTNVLTMMTDPSIKKFFGPQMSNADVQLMTSAGTTLNPELQSPAKMKEELNRLRDLVSRASLSVDGVTQFGLTPSGVRVGMTPDGQITDAQGNFYDKDGHKISK